MDGFQIWLVRTLKEINPVAAFMHSAWGWPIAESVHFLGLSLLIGYPTKALTNPVFYLKLLLIAVGLWLFRRIGRRVFDDAGDERAQSPPVQRLAIISLVCWVGAITAGRFLAYTYTRLMAIF